MSAAIKVEGYPGVTFQPIRYGTAKSGLGYVWLLHQRHDGQNGIIVAHTHTVRVAEVDDA